MHGWPGWGAIGVHGGSGWGAIAAERRLKNEGAVSKKFKRDNLSEQEMRVVGG